jgi:hypothetical protein
MPQPPQFAPSLVVSTQAPEQGARPVAHEMVHASPSHAATPLPREGPGQFVPQSFPQLFGSRLRAQLFPQACAPGLQA